MSSDDPFNTPLRDYEKPGHAINGRILFSAIIFLFLMVWFVFMLHVYAKWFWRQPARFPRQRSASRRRRFNFTGQEPASLQNVGLDSTVLKSLPVFVHKSQNLTDELECAVCLSKLEENEKCRLLPNCRHSFHVECIDMWFISHSTCPLCRIGAQPEQDLEFSRIGQISNTVIGPITSGIHDNLNLEQRHSIVAGCAEESNLQNPTNIFSWDGQKQMNDQGTSGGRSSIIPQIRIEIPKRSVGFSWPGEVREPHQPNG